MNENSMKIKMIYNNYIYYNNYNYIINNINNNIIKKNYLMND